MAESDWTALTAANNNALDAGDISKGVSGPSVFTGPNGGGTFVHGFRALQQAIGAAGYIYSGDSAFNPISGNKGGMISAAMRRYSAGSDYSPFIGLITGTDVTADTGYFLALTDSSPYQIGLFKGIPSNFEPSSSTLLRVSDASYESNALWFHLRLEVLVNPQLDVRLSVFENDLDVNAVTAPVWDAISGMDDFNDDANGVLAGSVPYTSGFRMVYGHYNAASGKTSLFDHIEVARQVSP